MPLSISAKEINYIPTNFNKSALEIEVQNRIIIKIFNFVLKIFNIYLCDYGTAKYSLNITCVMTHIFNIP